LKEKVINFEHWLSSGKVQKLPNNIPHEMLKLLDESEDAYMYYRNYLFVKYFIIPEDVEVFEEFKNLIDTIPDKSGIKLIFDSFSKDKFTEIYKSKRLNVHEIALSSSGVEFTRNSCFLYQSFYEIEMPLLLLSSFIILMKKNEVEITHQSFRDKKNNLVKGKCISFIKSGLQKHPALQNAFSIAYNVKLRNTIGHNDYEIDNEFIKSIQTNEKVSKEKFQYGLHYLQLFNNLTLYYFTSYNNDIDSLKGYGVLSVGFAIYKEVPVLSLYQLECFYRIQPKEKWLKKVKFETKNNISFSTKFSSKISFSGEMDSKMKDWINALRKFKTIKTVIVPIVNLGENYSGEKILKTDCGDFTLLEEYEMLELKFSLTTK
jgi:hypothetical protein